MNDKPRILGIDNVMFLVADLDASIRFYEMCGLVLKFRLEPPGIALFSIGDEAAGLLIRRGEGGIGTVWLEVPDATSVATSLSGLGVVTTRVETMTGITVEARDPAGNKIGFADYSKRPELARERSHKSIDGL